MLLYYYYTGHRIRFDESAVGAINSIGLYGMR